MVTCRAGSRAPPGVSQRDVRSSPPQSTAPFSYSPEEEQRACSHRRGGEPAATGRHSVGRARGWRWQQGAQQEPSCHPAKAKPQHRSSTNLGESRSRGTSRRAQEKKELLRARPKQSFQSSGWRSQAKLPRALKPAGALRLLGVLPCPLFSLQRGGGGRTQSRAVAHAGLCPRDACGSSSTALGCLHPHRAPRNVEETPCTPACCAAPRGNRPLLLVVFGFSSTCPQAAAGLHEATRVLKCVCCLSSCKALKHRGHRFSDSTD